MRPLREVIGGCKDRVLSEADLAHHQRIVIALGETIRIVGRIDEVIEDHGG